MGKSNFGIFPWGQWKNEIKYSQSKRVKKLGNIFDFLDIKNKKNIEVHSNCSTINKTRNAARSEQIINPLRE